MNILALDTATNTLHLALKTDTEYEEVLSVDNLQHSEALLSQIKALLKAHGLEIKDLNLLICTRGPGSFTSLRIGMATLKGFSLAVECPIVSVPTLEVIADNLSFFDGLIIPCIDAKKRRYYLAGYKNGQEVIETMDGNAEDIIDEVNKEDKVLVTGPDAIAFAEKLQAFNPNAKLYVDNIEKRNLCQSLIKLGLKHFEEDGEDDIGQGPVYVRRSDAEEALIERNKAK